MSISTRSDSTSTLNAEAELVEINATFYTLIPSRFPPISLFKRIANGRDEEVAEIESLTNPRLRERERLLDGAAAVDVESPLLQNWNHAPFTYPNPEGSRFFGRDVQALELADDLQTALAISVRKREQFLKRTKEPPIGLDMRVISRRVHGRFLNGLSVAVDSPRELLLSVGAAAATLKADGILYRPPDRPSAGCVAVLNGATLDRAIQGEHFRYVWNGSRIETLYSFSSGKEIDPAHLSQAEEALAV